MTLMNVGAKRVSHLKWQLFDKSEQYYFENADALDWFYRDEMTAICKFLKELDYTNTVIKKYVVDGTEFWIYVTFKDEAEEAEFVFKFSGGIEIEK